MWLFTVDDDYDNKESGVEMSPRPPFEQDNEKDKENDDCYGIMASFSKNFQLEREAIVWYLVFREKITEN